LNPNKQTKIIHKITDQQSSVLAITCIAPAVSWYHRRSVSFWALYCPTPAGYRRSQGCL